VFSAVSHFYPGLIFEGKGKNLPFKWSPIRVYPRVGSFLAYKYGTRMEVTKRAILLRMSTVPSLLLPLVFPHFCINTNILVCLFTAGWAWEFIISLSMCSAARYVTDSLDAALPENPRQVQPFMADATITITFALDSTVNWAI